MNPIRASLKKHKYDRRRRRRTSERRSWKRSRKVTRRWKRSLHLHKSDGVIWKKKVSSHSPSFRGMLELQSKVITCTCFIATRSRYKVASLFCTINILRSSTFDRSKIPSEQQENSILYLHHNNLVGVKTIRWLRVILIAGSISPRIAYEPHPTMSCFPKRRFIPMSMAPDPNISVI